MSSSEEIVTVGVDVGGTNTDAAVIAGKSVLGFAKHVTTQDITTGVVRAIAQALNNSQDAAKGKALKVERVHIGTTHFVNAVVQRKNLVKVSIIRLCGKASTSLPPYSYFPENLRKVIQGTVHLADGGYEFDGATEISSIKVDQIKKITQEIKDAGIRNVVVSGIFSPVTADQENKVVEMIKSAWPEVSITPSHHIGHLGILERENAAVLNEAVRPLADTTVRAFRVALDRLGLTCPFYLTQNDGTLISASQAMQMPVFTFASGTTNSMRGAAFLSRLKDGIVIDIGGTTSDVGMLIGGFPREASTKVSVADVQTNFRMPDVYSIGLGGGSIVTEQKDSQGNISVQIGPVSVGYQLMEKALVFGGSVLTTSDIAVAAKLANLGDKTKVSSISQELIEAARQEMTKKLELAIDQVKVAKDPVPAILVGGGSVLVDVSKQLFEGCSEIIKPPHFEVANAVGAALSQVSGMVDIVMSLDGKSREDAMAETKSKAIQAAVESGADESTVEITEIQDVSLAYLPGNATRIKVKAVGDIKLGDGSQAALWSADHAAKVLSAMPVIKGVTQTHASSGQNISDQGEERGDNYPETEPYVDSKTGEWILSHWDIECIAVGAGILGCGGGGNPNDGRIRCHREIDLGRKIRVITPERYSKLPHKDKRAVPVGYVGSPTIFIERLPSNEIADAMGILSHLYNVRGYTNDTQQLKNQENIKIERKEGVSFIESYSKDLGGQPAQTGDPANITGVMCIEIGGSNGMEQMIVGAQMEVPVIDCDFMGRAFPEIQMCTNAICGIPDHPFVISNYDNWHCVALQTDSPKQLEDLIRDACVRMGCAGGSAGRPLTDKEILDTAIMHSVSRAWRLGRAVLHARREKMSPIEAILTNEGGNLLLTGKITDIERKTVGGFARGKLILEGLGNYTKQNLEVEFQNENLVAQRSVGGKKELLACTPDLIAIVDVDTGEPITTEMVRYGLRVAVLAMPAPPELTTEEAIKCVGPQAFNYPKEEVVYRPTMQYKAQPPVPPV